MPPKDGTLSLRTTPATNPENMKITDLPVEGYERVARCTD
jgi:hypothetical protein